MKKLFALIVLLSAATGYAQSFADYANAHRETTFAIPEATIYNTHTVYLHDNERMIIEMADVTDYTMLKDLDSLLRTALNDVAFYKDSATALQNVRIDYDLKLESDDIIMRFKKHDPNGDVYVKRHGETLRMKIARDTFRIIVRKPLVEHNSHMHMHDYPVQVTFIMNNYANLYGLLQEKVTLNSIIDTLSKAVLPEVYQFALDKHQTTIEYNPYTRNKYMDVTHIDTAPIVDIRKNKYFRRSFPQYAPKNDHK